MTETIASIKKALASIEPDDERLRVWATDSRKGVQHLLEQYQRRIVQKKAATVAFQERFQFERSYWQAGYQAVAGIDEVGRGPLAGPVVAAAVILPHDFDQTAVIDSKQLSAQKRNTLYQAICDQALAIGLGQVEAPTIDAINIYQAARLAMGKAVAQLKEPAQALLVDAMTLDTTLPQKSLIKGDARSNSIAAASIVAKVTRDQLMVEYDRQYPGYGFAKNVGYGTKAHLAAIERQGITPIHRRTFAPIKNRIKDLD